MKRIFCFGELLLRLSPALNGEWIRRSVMDFHLGGAELNVANALACWKHPVSYCSAIPDHYLSKEILKSLAETGIDPSPILLTGNRIGAYYLPQGADLKNAGVIYDRAHSAFSELKTGMINWSEMLNGMDWFHFSAITPALNEHLARVCEEGLKEAARRKLTISVDLNYRSRLWQYGKDPTEIMPGLVQYCGLVMGNIWSARRLLGIGLEEGGDHMPKEFYIMQAKKTAALIMEKFPACKGVANTFRFDQNEGIKYYACLAHDQQQNISKEWFIPKAIDRVGTGDCFMAGLIYGMNHFKDDQQILDFATAAAVGKFAETGDFTRQTISDIENRLNRMNA